MLALVPVYPVKFTLRHIPAQIQQFPDALGCLFPGNQRGCCALRGFALCHMDTFGVVPNGILPAIQIKASTIFTIVFHQEPGVVLQRLILFEISANDKAAVLIVGSNAQRLVNDLLRKRRTRKERTLRLALGWSRTSKGREIKKGHLLALLGRELADVRLNEIFLFVNKLCCPSGHQVPGEHRFFCAGKVGTLPHEKPVLLRLIAQALAVCDDLGVSVLIGGFEIIRPFPLVGVNGKEQLDLLLFVFEVVVLVGDNSHDLRFIKKSGQLLAVRLLRIA